MEQLFQAVGYATGAALLFLGKKLFDTVYEYVKKEKLIECLLNLYK